MRFTPLILLLAACSPADAGSSGGDGTGTGTETAGTGAGSGSGSGTAGSCYDPAHSVVADIDGTLTTEDGEFIQQLLDTTHDPAERDGASELIQDYHDLGYTVVYLTARALDQVSTDDAMLSAEQLTTEWLVGHGFPLDGNTRLEMSDSFVFGDSAATYKTERLGELQAEGHVFEYAYGNADSDITAYGAAGIAKDVTFIIGEQGGMGGTVAVDGEGWVDHAATHLPTVTDWCADGS